jgi:hypothetical protein
VTKNAEAGSLGITPRIDLLRRFCNQNLELELRQRLAGMILEARWTVIWVGQCGQLVL